MQQITMQPNKELSAKEILESHFPTPEGAEDTSRIIEAMEEYASAWKAKYDELQNEVQQLRQWKREGLLIMNPIWDYGRHHPDIKPGESISTFVIERCKQYDEQMAKVALLSLAIADAEKREKELKAENERLKKDYVDMINGANDDHRNLTLRHMKLKSEHAALKEQAEALARTSRDLNMQIDEMWNNNKMSELVPGGTIAMILSAQRASYTALSSYNSSTNTKKENNG